MADIYSRNERPLKTAAVGAAWGLLAAIPAVFLAVMSGGAGHGDYAAARALFHVPMLLTLVEDSIGPFSIALTLLQFPLYGAVTGYGIARNSWRPPLLLSAIHLAGVIACFSGVLPNFS